MGFVVTQKQSYIWPVTVNLPVDHGQFEKSTFEAEFKRLPQSRVEEYVDDIVGGRSKDTDIAREVVIGWRGVANEPGGPDLPFSPSALDAVLEIPTVATSIVKAWMESLTGARRGN